MKKDCSLYFRLSADELELIKSTSSKFDMNVTDFILSVLIPYCINNK